MPEKGKNKKKENNNNKKNNHDSQYYNQRKDIIKNGPGTTIHYLKEFQVKPEEEFNHIGMDGGKFMISKKVNFSTSIFNI